jgi:selenophosphate synthetase-related protein
MDDEIKHATEHMMETNSIRKVFWHMDERVEKLLFGIQQGDDAIIVGDTVVNMEGPYPLKIGRKTGLIHTCSDIVIMGGRPLYALNSMQVDSIEQACEVAEDLKKQSLGLGVPIVGGNTQMENELIPCISFTVVGRLLGEPTADCGAMIGDKIFMLGDVVEGEIGERVYRAKTKFETYLDLLKTGVSVHASKDCSRGGWFGNLMEILVKSKRGIRITSIPYSRITRYLGTYLVSIPKSEACDVVSIAAKHRCPVVDVGVVTKELDVVFGRKKVVSEKKMMDLVRRMPYRRPRRLS